VERLSQASKLSLDVAMRQSRNSGRPWGSAKLANAAGNETGSGFSVPCSQAIRAKSDFSPPGSSVKRKTRFLRVEGSRPRREFQAGPANYVVQSAVAENDFVVSKLVAESLAGALPRGAAHFENVRKICGEVHANGNVGGLGAIVQEANLHVAGGTTEKLQAKNMQRSAGQCCKAVGVAVNIGQVHRQERVVFADVGAQQQRLVLVDVHGELRQMPALGMKKTELGRSDEFDVTEAVEHGKRVAVLQNARAVVRQRGGRSNVVFVLQPNDIRQCEALPYRVSEESSRGAGSAKLSAVASNS
jgi:hypothetical protein